MKRGPTTSQRDSQRSRVIASAIVILAFVGLVLLLLGPLSVRSPEEAVARAKQARVEGQDGLTYGRLVDLYMQATGNKGEWVAERVQPQKEYWNWQVVWEPLEDEPLYVLIQVPPWGRKVFTGGSVGAVAEMLLTTQGEEAANRYRRVKAGDPSPTSSVTSVLQTSTTPTTTLTPPP